PDPGRANAYALLDSNPFGLGGPYSDDPTAAEVAKPTPSDLGAFRTPSLRNITLSAPYMHNGRFDSLRDAIVFHLDGGGTDTSAFVGSVDPLLVRRSLSDGEIDDMVAFFSALAGAYPRLPWADWPQL